MITCNTIHTMFFIIYLQFFNILCVKLYENKTFLRFLKVLKNNGDIINFEVLLRVNDIMWFL